MIVVTKTKKPMRGLGAAFSRDVLHASNRNRVSTSMAQSGGWASIKRLNGLGEGDGFDFTQFLKDYGVWLAGGVAIGGVAWYLLKKKK